MDRAATSGRQAQSSIRQLADKTTTQR